MFLDTQQYMNLLSAGSVQRSGKGWGEEMVGTDGGDSVCWESQAREREGVWSSDSSDQEARGVDTLGVQDYHQSWSLLEMLCIWGRTETSHRVSW